MKSLEEFVELFAEQFDETGAAEFSADKNFRELDEWSSLIALSIIAMVDDEFDITLVGDDIKNSNTIRDIYDIVASKA
ncbi:acyl carrier protein [Bacteroides sp. HF-5092]|uniref:acyl carrier protein n=1 Tax=Bacteroides TaxID=816 RepID=UPI001177FB9A|nr:MULTISPECIES: acyl carrier protein [Bacteroides]TRX46742.1 acyl carrier protein [Bacteroides sp. HF-5092]